MERREFLLLATALATCGCSGALDAGSRTPSTAPSSGEPQTTTLPPAPGSTETTQPPAPTTDPRMIAARATVPVLCYHQIRDWRPDESATSRALTVPPALFAEHMQLLADEAWNPITVEQYFAHLTGGAELPDKPIILSFDDASVTHFTEALPVLQAHRFKAAFFIMTVVLGKPNWMTKEHIRELDKLGMSIGAHTYNHLAVPKWKPEDVEVQLVDPAQDLEKIVGHKVEWFAYPYGVWKPSVLPQVSGQYKAAFQLEDPLEQTQPLMTLRRTLINSLGGMERFRGQLSSTVKSLSAPAQP